ncbi:MAG: cell division protein FtsQ/DivIB [Sarcina sp.]
MDKHKVKKNSKKVELYFKEKNKKKRRKKIAFVSLIIIIATGVFLLKSPIFNIEKVVVMGNKMLKEAGIIDKKEIEGKNVFLLDTNIIKDKVRENPYIESAEVKRTNLNTISISVKERKMFYKVIHEEKVYVLNNQLYIMDILEDDKDLSLVALFGLVPDNLEIGARIVNSDEITKIAHDVGNNLIEKQKESIFSDLNLTDRGSISIYVNEIKIILGKPVDLDLKYQKAMDIINSENINFTHGYIDVSVLEHPVIKLESENENINKTKKEDTQVLDKDKEISQDEATVDGEFSEEQGKIQNLQEETRQSEDEKVNTLGSEEP